MAREITLNQSGNLTFQERATDANGDAMSVVRVELDAIDGTQQQGSDRTPNWLNYNTTFNSGDPSEMLIDVTVVGAELNIDSTYTFLFEVSDGQLNTTRTVDLEVKELVGYSGEALYLIDDGTSNVYEISLSTPWDVSTASYVGATSGFGDLTEHNIDCFFSPNGEYLLISMEGTEVIQLWQCSTSFDPSTATLLNSADVGGFDTTIAWYPNDGSYIIVFTQNGGDLSKHNLSTPHDLTTEVQEWTVSDIGGVNSGNPQNAWYLDNGEKLYVHSSGGLDRIKEYDLSTPFDGTTRSYIRQKDTSNWPNNFGKITINNEGTRLILLGFNGTIYQYNFGTAKDITSIPDTPENTFDLGTASGEDRFYGHGVK